MEKEQITHIIKDVIDRAAREKGWSLAQLTRKLGKGENTLHRWRNGSTTAYDLESLIALFNMAGLSMDQSFGIAADGEDSPNSSDLKQLDQLAQDVAEIKRQLTALQPAIKLLGLMQWLADNQGKELPPG